MSKIADVVDLKTGYANFVELKGAFERDQENMDRMAMYRPTTAHRAAFERICRGLYQPNDRKFYLLSGSYGTGKSHLCLMLANFLSISSASPEIAGFYENYARLDSDTAKMLRNIRKDGQYLVAICDYSTGRNFEDAVLKAIYEACEAKGLSMVETEFDEAERLLSEWEKTGGEGRIRDFYDDFCKTLEKTYPGLTVEHLRSGLRNYESEFMVQFRNVFTKMMGGIKFHTQSSNLISVVRNLLKQKEFRNRFKGLAVFYDEFGSVLGNGLYSTAILQGFMEKICKELPNVMFVGCIHKDFKDYADRLSKREANVMGARVTQVDLRNEGIEEIIGAIVETDKESEVWRKEVRPKIGVLDQLIPRCKDLNLFPWIEDVERIRKRVLEDIYGVHPMALACLLCLSTEIGSDARSTFTFFSGDVQLVQGSYPDFIQNADVVLAGGELNLYTVNRLFTFFQKELSQKNNELREGQRQFVNGYYASLDALRKLQKNDLFGLEYDKRIDVLRTILIYQLCSIPTTLENLQFGHYCLTGSERNEISRYLQDMTKGGVLFLRQQSKTYELMVSHGEDPYGMIERFVEDASLHPSDIVASFMEEAAGKQAADFIPAKQYNMHFNEDKRLRRVFVQAKDLEDRFWSEIRETKRAKFKPTDSFEGTLVYALCETQADVKAAEKAAKGVQDEDILIAVPHKPQPFLETLLRVKACRHFLPPNEAEKISAQIESRLRDILDNPEDGYLASLKRIFGIIESGIEASLYWKGGEILVDRPPRAHVVADMYCAEMFKQRCQINHVDLNFCHDNRWLTRKNTALEQAVKVLFGDEKPFIDNGSIESHGEKRYLEKVLLKGAAAFRRIRTEGTVTFFAPETSSGRINGNFPFLKELCRELEELDVGAIFSVGDFCEKMRKPPYGVGGTQMILALAHVVRGYGERLIAYRDTTQMVEQPIRDYEDLVGLVADPSSKTVFVIREISIAQRTLVNSIAETVGAEPLKYGEVRAVGSTYDALEKWWRSIPNVARVLEVYEKRSRQRLKELRAFFAGLSNNSDRFDLVLNRLPAIYHSGFEVKALSDNDVKTITEQFAKDTSLFKSGEQIVFKDIAAKVCVLFGGEGDLVECERLVTEWHRGLNPSQRDPLRFGVDEVKSLLKRLNDQTQGFQIKLFEQLPRDFGFGPVSEWTSIHTEDFLEKLAQAKKEIEDTRKIVAMPQVGQLIHELGEGDTFLVKTPAGAARLVYSTDGKDPQEGGAVWEAKSAVELRGLLGDQSRVKVILRAIDSEGNSSAPVTVEVVSKERKYDLTFSSGLFGQRATFTCPEDRAGMIAVIKSVLNYARGTGLLAEETVDDLQRALKTAD